MRTKTLLLSVALGAAGAASSWAQTPVYSQNAVGYVNKVLPAGYSLLANPLKATDNTLGALIPSAPLFSNFYKWTGNGFDIATFTFTGWDKPSITLAPGEGGFINASDSFTNTFVGEVMQGTLSNPIPAGYSIRSSMVPQAGAVDTLGLTKLSTFDNLYKWNGTGYQIFTLTFAGWDPSTPSIDVAEAVFLNAQAATSWDRVFSVNQ